MWEVIASFLLFPPCRSDLSCFDDLKYSFNLSSIFLQSRVAYDLVACFFSPHCLVCTSVTLSQILKLHLRLQVSSYTLVTITFFSASSFDVDGDSVSLLNMAALLLGVWGNTCLTFFKCLYIVAVGNSLFCSTGDMLFVCSSVS